jgi:hypothetical protein|tara:strand:- start:1892 stop:2752 length:861 start_codon:yes stop_codon:yes gene_type:complete
MSNLDQEISDNMNVVNETYDTKNKKNIKPIWKSEQEDILKKWADKALCYKTMHDRATKKYWCLNAWFNIPIIILSTLTGTGNFAQGTFGPKYGPYLILAIGTANLLSAIMGTIAQYINVAGMLEGHRFASISWDKYARGISVELGKVRSDRQDPASYLKRCQEDYDRLIEISPNFSNDVIEWFNKLIQTGEISDDNQFCGVCCYEWFCLPCGFRGCKKFKICCSCCPSCLKGDLKEKEIKRKQFSSNWGDIELPEILGKFRPTIIVREEGNNSENKYRIPNMDIDV